MSDELSGVGSAFLSIGADMNPLSSALGGLAQKMISPLTSASIASRTFLQDSFTTTGDAVAALLSTRLGDGVKGLGDLMARSIGGTFNTVLTAVLGETIGGTIGGVIQRALDTVNSMTFGLVAKVLNAASGPIREALSAPLGDLDRWVHAAIEADEKQAKFNAMLIGTGESAGWSSAQLNQMQEDMASSSKFSGGSVRDAQSELLKFDKVRGDVFGEAIKAGAALSQIYGGDIVSNVKALGFALDSPAQGVNRLKRSFRGLIDDETVKKIKDANGVLEKQAIIMEAINKKAVVMAEAKGDTIEDRLARLKNTWNSMGRSIGESILPITGLFTDMALGVVNTMSGIVKPIFGDLKTQIESVVGGIKGWLGENSETFTEWGRIIKVIVTNAYETVKGALKGMFGEVELGGVKDYWETFKSGVTEVLLNLAALASSWDLIKETAGFAWLYIKNRYEEFLDDLGSGAFMAKMMDMWDQAKTTGMTAFQWLSDKINDLFGDMIDLVALRLKLLFLKLQSDWQSFATGGMRAGINDEDAEKLTEHAMKNLREQQAAKRREKAAEEGKPEAAAPENPELPAVMANAARRAENEEQAKEALKNLFAEQRGRILEIANAPGKEKPDMKPNPKPFDEELKSGFKNTGFADLHKQMQEALKGDPALDVQKQVKEELVKGNEERKREAAAAADARGAILGALKDQKAKFA